MQRDLHVEDDAKLRFYSNVLYPVEALLGGAEFKPRFTGMLGVSDFILCTNNPTVGLMPVEIKMFHNLRRPENESNNLYVSRVFHPDSTNPLYASRAVPRLLYKGYIYDGYLFALVLQLIEGAHHVDPKRLTKEEKKIICLCEKIRINYNDCSLRPVCEY
ncbi:hypothetical protein RhiirC2_709850 [Rhizophagus irregularis]|uniref:Uncharacterized protein n=1 Tax=Rhizophagus irregularis TaxID=588596 RepID=A0A2N1NGX0_9GLOM|nr:hypothetical protein RhiirC2_709850 [Rhizophagus irregularis]